MPLGYPLHIDVICDEGKGGTFLCRAGWNGWTVRSVRVSSENARELRLAGLPRKNRDSEPPRRTRAWPKEARPARPRTQETPPQDRQERHTSN